MKPLFATYSRPHLVGIGGAGMEALARLLAASGCQVSGTDIHPAVAVRQLQSDGFDVTVGHGASALGETDLVVYSAAIPETNPELVEARRRGIATVSRAELLGVLSRQRLTVGIAGSHGKTTTSSMLAEIMICAGWDPSIAIGGWRHGRCQARLGQGPHFVVEADEFRRAFLHLAPSWALVTSVDREHVDCYTDLAAVEDAFIAFLRQLPFYGHAVVAGDGLVGNRILSTTPPGTVTYGVEASNTYRATAVRRRAWGSCFTLVGPEGSMGEVELPVPGIHNLRNALGAAAMALRLGVDVTVVQQALGSYTTVSRRFEKRAEIDDILVVDDYAHHPAEISASLATAGDTGRRIIAVFQPHLYSRTQALYEEFATALAGADIVFLAPVYGAREQPVPGVDSSLIADALVRSGHTRIQLVDDVEKMAERVMPWCRAGDLVLTMGAGNIDRLAGQLEARMRAAADSGQSP